ncbi:MAG: hypothetical protein JWM40_935 [Frankiales bacterium]|nr:hypothetical protein [Frankiales bacterium]
MPRHAACPACGAALRPGSPWCTLCYADLRTPEERPVAEPPPPPAVPAGDPLTQPLIDFLPSSVLPPAPRAPESPLSPLSPLTTPSPLDDPVPDVGPTWPCSACGTSNPIAAAKCGACGAAFLATVALESRAALVLPVVGDLTRMSRSQRLLVAMTLVVALVLFVAVITLLLAKRPPNQGDVVPPTPLPSATQPFTQPTTAPAFGAPTAGPTATAFPTP